MLIGFRVAERFSHESSPAWDGYVEWSRLHHLREVVGLDFSLCPPLRPEMSASDWQASAFPGSLDVCFTSLGHALGRGGRLDPTAHQVLAVSREPVVDDMAAFAAPGFVFKGFDLMDEPAATSALTNCGGFDDVFRSSELSDCGLVTDIARAYEIRQQLAHAYPQEPHASCTVWALWRIE